MTAPFSSAQFGGTKGSLPQPDISRCSGRAGLLPRLRYRRVPANVEGRRVQSRKQTSPWRRSVTAPCGVCQGGESELPSSLSLGCPESSWAGAGLALLPMPGRSPPISSSHGKHCPARCPEDSFSKFRLSFTAPLQPCMGCTWPTEDSSPSFPG